MKTFPSKLGLELVIPLAVLLGSVGAGMLYLHNWPGLVIVSGVSLFITHLFLTTYYQIEDGWLRIKSGFLVNQTVPIQTIKKIVATRNPLSSPATSMDRLEVIYNRYDSVLISPSDKAGFIQELLQINPAIEVRLTRQVSDKSIVL